MVVFKKIRFKNLLSYGNIPTEFELDKEIITSFTGSTGAGKSTLLTEAICFALFGKPFRKINKNNLVNFKNKRELLTEIWFSVDDKEYYIKRGIKPDIFEVYENDNLINQNASIKDYQTVLETVLGFNHNIFTQIIIVGHATYVSFMKLSADHRRKFIETILGLDIFSVMFDIHKQNITQLKNKFAELKTSITITQEKIKLTEKYIEKLQADIKRNQDEQAAKFSKYLEELKAKEQSLLNAINSAKASLEELDVNLIQSLQTKLSKFNTLLNKADIQINRITKDHNFFDENANCPSCGQTIDDNFKDAKLKELSNKSIELSAAKKDITNKLIDYQDRLNELSNTLKHNKEVQVQINILEAKLHENDNQQKRLLEDSKNLSLGDNEKIASEQDKLDGLLNLYNGLLEEKNDILIRHEYLEAMTAMLKDSGIKKSIIHQYINLINTSINRYLKALGFYATFTLDENFEEEILARGITKLNYGNFSEGERLIIDLAIILTWRDISRLRGGISTNLFILDDMLNNVDPNKIKNIIELLGEMQAYNSYIISPPDDVILENIPVNVIIDKVNGFSSII